jgi:hypothetical protein
VIAGYDDNGSRASAPAATDEVIELADCPIWGRGAVEEVTRYDKHVRAIRLHSRNYLVEDSLMVVIE